MTDRSRCKIDFQDSALLLLYHGFVSHISDFNRSEMPTSFPTWGESMKIGAAVDVPQLNYLIGLMLVLLY